MKKLSSVRMREGWNALKKLALLVPMFLVFLTFSTDAAAQNQPNFKKRFVDEASARVLVLNNLTQLGDAGFDIKDETEGIVTYHRRMAKYGMLKVVLQQLDSGTDVSNAVRSAWGGPSAGVTPQSFTSQGAANGIYPNVSQSDLVFTMQQIIDMLAI